MLHSIEISMSHIVYVYLEYLLCPVSYTICYLCLYLAKCVFCMSGWLLTMVMIMMLMMALIMHVVILMILVVVIQTTDTNMLVGAWASNAT